VIVGGGRARVNVGDTAPLRPQGLIVSAMKAVLFVVATVIAVIVVLKVIAAVSVLVLAFIPAAIALGGGYAVGQIHGARRERRKLEAKRTGQLPG